MPFQFKRMEIPEIVLVESEIFPDVRGFIMETYKRTSFSANGIPETFVQDNFSHSGRGVLRGLHYQKNPKAQGKLVMALGGEILDVAVDIRHGSPNYGKWVGHILSSENSRMVYVPEGFAHGFCVLSDEAQVLYKMTEEYAPEFDRGIRWDDPTIGISWVIEKPILSPKDSELPSLEEADNNFIYKGEPEL